MRRKQRRKVGKTCSFTDSSAYENEFLNMEPGYIELSAVGLSGGFIHVCR